MDLSKRIVTSIPLDELWSDVGVVDARRVRHLRLEEVRDLLSSGSVRFVVASVGAPLRWIPVEEQFEFWKHEARERIVNPAERFQPDDLPSGLAFVASEWLTPVLPPIILLEANH